MIFIGKDSTMIYLNNIRWQIYKRNCELFYDSVKKDSMLFYWVFITIEIVKWSKNDGWYHPDYSTCRLQKQSKIKDTEVIRKFYEILRFSLCTFCFIG